jgi:hypothetical protein
MPKSKYKTCKLLIATVLVSTSWSDASGTTWYSADPSAASVQTAINSASDGDTVIVPAGSATWTTTVACTKAIIITGAGIGQTVITSSLTGAHILTFDGTKAFRLSGITFLDTGAGYAGGMVMATTGNTWRIHDCAFGNSTSKLKLTGLIVEGTVGLIDHCTFNLAGGGSTGMWVRGGGPGSTASDAIWNQTVAWGTADFVFIEDCTFTTALPNVANGAMDLYGGANMCFRHNTVTNLTVGGHGYDSGGYRSPFKTEVYNNICNSTAHLAEFLQSRGGASLWHDNTCTDSSGYSNTIQLNAYREAPQAFTQLFVFNSNSGIANGTKVVDGNLAATPEVSTTTAASSNGVSLPAGTINVASTTGFPSSGQFLRVASSTSTLATTTVTYTGITGTSFTGCTGGSGTLATGDVVYKILFAGCAYPLRDQCGRTGPTIVGTTSTTQTLSPVYAWNNTINGSPMLVGGAQGAQVIVKNRDYYNSALPGYTPYPYPHPLVTGGPSAPTNLHVE